MSHSDKTTICECGCGEPVKRGCRFLRGHYAKLHPPIPKRIINQEVTKCACGCENELEKYDKQGRERKFISGHNLRTIPSPMQNPETAKRVSQKLKGRNRTKEHRENLSKALKGKKRDAEFKRKRSEFMRSDRNPMLKPEVKAKHLQVMQSDELKQKMSEALKGRVKTEEERRNLSKALKGRETPWLMGSNNPMYARSGEKAPSWKGGVIQNDLVLFDTYADRLVITEEVRRDPDNETLLQTKCTYCGKWYSPSRSSVKSRIGALNRSSGTENRLYCSQNCKKECPIYYQMKYPKGYRKATSREVQPELRQMVFQLDDWECIKCEATEFLHCHHITGVELNPIESADADNCITLCKKCHKWVHSQIGCRYIDLRREQCGQIFDTPKEELTFLLVANTK